MTNIIDMITDVKFVDKEFKMTIYDYDYYEKNDKSSIGNDIISKCIDSHDNCWEPFQSEITKELLKHGNNVFIDVGAHLGWYSIISSLYDNTTYSVDCNDMTIKKFQKTIALNNLKNITNIKEFVNASSKIDTIIDDIVAKHFTVQLVKCDIEGNEPLFIRKISKFIENKSIKNIILEISPLMCNEYAETVMYLQNMGYIVYDLGISSQRKLSVETTLESLRQIKKTFNSVDEINKYMDTFPEKQSNFLFSLGDF